MTVYFGPFSQGSRNVVRGVAAVLCAVVLVSTWTAFAQGTDVKTLSDRLERIQRDIEALNRHVYRGQSSPAGAQTPGAPAEPGVGGNQTIARLEVRLTQLEAELREATGRAENIGFQFEQINQRLDKLVGDIDYRLSVLERSGVGSRARTGAGSQPSGAPPEISAAPSPPGVQLRRPGSGGPSFATAPGALGTISPEDLAAVERRGGTPEGARPQTEGAPTQPPPPSTAAEQAAATPGVLPPGTPRDQYTYAFGLLRQAKYDEAETALRAFLDAHQDHPLVGNAIYWLGETYYVRGNFIQAAETFLKGYQTDPKGPKGPDTLLKLGMSLSALDKKREACAAFEKMTKDYPEAPDTIKRLVERERAKNECE